MNFLNKTITLITLNFVIFYTHAESPLVLKPKMEPASSQNNTQLLSDSFAQTSDVIAFVENNIQLSQLCDQRLATEQHAMAFNKWFTGHQSNFKATLDFKFAYEKTLASLYGESIIETFQKRDRLTLTQVSNEIEKIAAREDEAFQRSCHYWLTSIEDEKSFFHTQLSIGLFYFGQNHQKLAGLIADPANW
ncbi:hypothetical protein [Marinicellulosiphila megalodicopiae]|uniref:hypothetical protein n=1 Tax=Marinicellulosiphila megalodicopiae TaxID=2724896 RepID=UPI003BAF7386